MSKVDYDIRTDGEINVHELNWTVPNFNNLLENQSTREFRTDKPDPAIDCKFRVKIQFLGRDNDLIEIYYLSPNPVFLKTDLCVILSSYDERSLARNEYHTVQGNKWQFLATLFKRDITTDSSFLSRDMSLKLKCIFMIPDVEVNSFNFPETQMSHDFENLLSSGLFSDVTMKSADGNEYKVHKAVLASRSAVLRAHFEHNTLECQTNIIESSLDTEVLKEVLTFIYSDKAPRLDEIPEQLLAAADYYQLNRLKILCEEALHKKLTVESVIQTLQLADLHSAKRLKKLTLAFIRDGQAGLITKTEGWAKMKSVELIQTIYEYILTDNIEADIDN